MKDNTVMKYECHFNENLTITLYLNSLLQNFPFLNAH